MRRNDRKFYLIMGVPLLILFGLLFKPLSTVFFGEEVLLGTVPVDPVDLFYGDYVQLELDVETIPADKMDAGLKSKVKEMEERYRSGLKVYSTLEEDEGLFTVKGASLEKPKTGNYLKGTYVYTDETGAIHVDYGLNRFYLEEGSGLEIEEYAQKGKVKVLAKVSNGYAIMKELIPE
ncbi:MAG: GDYXXLXY domain-containing protein [Bacillus sp. (in: firmicutes)]